MLLVVFAPSLSRVLASGTTQVLAGWSELCTTMGLKTLPSDARSLSDTQAPLPATPGMGGDCDYCPLAASLSLVLLCLAALLPPLRQRMPLPPPAPRPRARDNLRGLGSRGPPILL